MNRAYINREVRKCIELSKFAFEGETDQQAIDRTLAERDAKDATKH